MPKHQRTRNEHAEPSEGDLVISAGTIRAFVWASTVVLLLSAIWYRCECRVTPEEYREQNEPHPMTLDGGADDARSDI